MFLYDWQFFARKEIGKCSLLENEYVLRCPKMQYFYISLHGQDEKLDIPDGFIKFYYNEDSFIKVFFKGNNGKIDLPIIFFVDSGYYWDELFALLLKEDKRYKFKIVFNSLPPKDTCIYLHGTYTKKDIKSFDKQILFVDNSGTNTGVGRPVQK